MSSHNEKVEWEAVAAQLCFTNEKEMLSTLYETKSIGDIARILNCGTATVHRRLGLFGIKRRPRGGNVAYGEQKYKLFHVDQRIIMYLGLTYCAKRLSVSNATLYKYKRFKAGGRNEGYNQNLTGNKTIALHPEGTK